MKKLVAAIICCLCVAPATFAANLIQVYRQALMSDPTYHKQIAQYKDTHEQIPQSIAQLLLNANVLLNTSYIRIPSSDLFADATFASSYNTHGYDLNLQQPIFNYSNWLNVSKAKSSVRSAYATLLAARQDLMLRVSKAYFNVLLAQDTLRFTLAEKRFVSQQLEQTEERFKVGLDAITSVYDARASYDNIIAQEIAARNNLKNSRESLREITGVLYTHLAAIHRQIPLIRPVPNNINSWVHETEQHNYTILAARYTALAARDNIKVQFGGHLPTLNGIYDLNYASAANFVNGSALGGRTESATLLLNIPIYTGGEVTSLTRQARYQYLTAVTGLEQTHRSQVSLARQTYNSIIAGISQVSADRQAIVSRRASLKATLAAFRVGTRTMVDVLDDQQNLTQAQQQYAQDQYDFINNILTLKSAAGRLCETDLMQINAWLNRYYTSVKHASYTGVHHVKKTLPTPYDDSTWDKIKTDINLQELKLDENKKAGDIPKEEKKLDNLDQPHLQKPEKLEDIDNQDEARNTPLQHERNEFTIQLISLQSAKAAQHYIERHKLSQKARYFTVNIQDKQRYDVIYGHYKTEQAAITALQQLAKHVYAQNASVIAMKDLPTQIGVAKAKG